MKPRLLLDTHVAIRWLTEPKKLSREQERVLDAAVAQGLPFAISAMSLLEIALLVSGGRSRLKMTADAFLEALQSDPSFQVLPLDFAVAAEVAALGPSLRDPSGRVIVATARVHGLRLVTSDQRVIASRLARVVE